MKKMYFPFLFIALFSCNTPEQKNKQEETPQAFHKEESSFPLSKSSYRDDLVEDLYSELKEKDPELNKLEENIENVKNSSQDSAGLFNTFNSRNNSYYNSVNSHVSSIKDSVLREDLRQVFDNSLSKYNIKTTPHNNLLETIKSRDLTLNDLHVILKLTKTLSVMEKYQVNNLPSLKPLENTIKAYDKTITKTSALSKK